jgi:hypothetical protein
LLYFFSFFSFSVAQTSIGTKRKHKTPQSSSATIASRKSPRGVSKKLGRSPLSRVDDGNEAAHNVQSGSTAVPASPVENVHLEVSLYALFQFIIASYAFVSNHASEYELDLFYFFQEGEANIASGAVPLAATVEVGKTTSGAATASYVGTNENPIGLY